MLLPVLYGMVILGEAPPALTLLGFGLAGLAVFLLGGGEKFFQSLGPAAVRQATPLRAFAYALGSGSCIAIFYVATRSCSAESGLWPLVVARLVALIAMAGLALIRRRNLPLIWPGAPLLVFILLSGALDGAGNAFYIIAAHGGDLGVVATITSLYPATTILLARYGLGERISLAQTIGVVSALAAIAAIVWGLQLSA
jgi:drug/metabolite transporter (DMT)-like permease